MSDIVLLHATFANDAEAERIAHAVVEERLAACANLLGACRSIYRWQGATETAVEARAIFKTTAELADRLRERIAELHSYDLPVIEGWPARTSAAALAWVRQSTSE